MNKVEFELDIEGLQELMKSLLTLPVLFKLFPAVSVQILLNWLPVLLDKYPVMKETILSSFQAVK